MKLPLSTQGCCWREPSWAQLGGGQWAPLDAPHHLPSPGGQQSNQTGLGHESPEAVMLCTGRRSIQACDRALLGPDKRHWLSATDSTKCVYVRVCGSLHASLDGRQREEPQQILSPMPQAQTWNGHL